MSAVARAGALRVDRLPTVGEARSHHDKVAKMGADATFASMPHSAGPYQESPDTVRARVKYTVGFAGAGGAFQPVKLSFKELMAGLVTMDGLNGEEGGVAVPLSVEQADAARARLTSTHSLPLSLRVSAARVMGVGGADFTHAFAFKMMDASPTPKSVTSDFHFKCTDSLAAARVPYPLYLAADPDTREALQAPFSLLDEHKQYWPVKLEHLYDGTSKYKDPQRDAEYVLMTKASKAAWLTHHAVSVRNQLVPDFINNAQYTFPGNKDVAEVPMNLYLEVVNAYRKKLEEVEGKSYNLSHVVFSLEPLFKLPANDPSTGRLHALVTIELVAHVPLAGAPGRASKLIARSRFGPPGQGDDDDEEDAEELEEEDDEDDEP